MPGYEFEISGKEVLDYICCICLMLIRKALLLPCSHTACKDCLEKWENEHPGRIKCPTCSKPYDKEKVKEGEQGKFIDRVVTNSLNVKCKQYEQGCEWVGTIANYDNHEKTCAYMQIPCRFEDCKNRVARKDMTTHEQNCPYRLVACRFCQLSVSFSNMEDHLNICEEYQIGCPNNKCDKKMKRKELNHHITEDCPFTILPCCFQDIGCNVQMARCESEKHFVDFSSFHSSLLLKTTDSLTNQLKQQQLDFQQKIQQQQNQFLEQFRQLSQQFQEQEKRHTEELGKQSQQFQEQLKQQQLQQDKRHAEEMEILRKRLDDLEELVRLTDEEKTHNWTFEELDDLLSNDQFHKFNAILLSNRQLSNQQKRDKNNYTLLHSASFCHAPIRTMELLVEKGCKLTKRDNDNDLPIHTASCQNNFKALEWMLCQDIKLLNEKGECERTPLHCAAWNNKKETVELLLSHDADVNAKDGGGMKADEWCGDDAIEDLIKRHRRCTMNTNDILERCENRLSYLNNKVLETTKIKQNVHETAENTKKTLRVDLEEIKQNFNKLLESSFERLSGCIDETVAKDLEHLQDVEDGLAKDIEKIKALVNKAKERPKSSDLQEINRSISDIGKGGLDMPLISLSFSSKINESAMTAAEEKVKELLVLNMTGTLQILECIERPGAISVRWDEQPMSDSESVATDNSSFTEFILQATNQTSSGDDHIFTTIYEGEEMQYTMNFAHPNKIYSFRVCQYFGNGSGGGVCGAWSVVKSASTSLPPHVWGESDCTTDNGLQLYQLSNGDRTATKIFPESSRILCSMDPSYKLGQQLTFWIEETGESSANDGIGLITCKKQIQNKQLTKCENATVMTSKGSIFVNGNTMVTKLPALKKNSVVVFQATKLNSSGKLRVSISVDDKEVTYDWNTASEESNALYFACVFEHTGWQLSVG